MQTKEQEVLHDQLLELYHKALTETIAAILSKQREGIKPRHSREPQISPRENGFPSISDAWFSESGPLDHCSVLEPPYGDEVARQRGRYPAEQFPAFHAIVKFLDEDPTLIRTYSSIASSDLEQIHLRLQIEGAANVHIHKFGLVDTTRASSTTVLHQIMNGLLAKRLGLAIVVPIALTQFDFSRVRLAPDVFIIRMSAALQRARWKGKAYGISGHESVLSSATHALVVTGWGIENDGHWQLARTLSEPTPAAREIIDIFFAALRLETGIETGYAQELRLARRWRMRHDFDRPEVFAVGARRYPESFDDFGWLRNDIPVVTRDQATQIAIVFQKMRELDEPRLVLARGRLNTAMIRDDPADSILDSTIGLELLLGDTDNQAISWKLRMRAAALAGLGGDKQSMEAASVAVKKVYELRSAIVHGASRKRRKANADNAAAGKSVAIDTLRAVLKAVILHPKYLDPLCIDRDLMMIPRKN